METFRYSSTMEEIVVKIDGKEHNVKIEESESGKIKVYLGKEVFEIETTPSVLSDLEQEQQKKEKITHGDNVIVAPLPGTIIEINVENGKEVLEGDTLIKLVAMKMENEITAPKSGRIKTVKVKKNDTVNKGDVLIILE